MVCPNLTMQRNQISLLVASYLLLTRIIPAGLLVADGQLYMVSHVLGFV